MFVDLQSQVKKKKTKIESSDSSEDEIERKDEVAPIESITTIITQKP